MSVLLATTTTRDASAQEGPTINTILHEDRGAIEVVFYWPDEQEHLERSYRGRDLDEALKASENLVAAWMKRKIIATANPSPTDQASIESKLGGMSVHAYLKQCQQDRKSALQQRAAQHEGITAAGMVLDL